MPDSAAITLLAPTSPTRDAWVQLTDQLNNTTDIDDLWAKFTVTDKVLTMFGEEDWSEKNLPFFGLQHHVWWVTQAQNWLSLSHVRTTQEYIQTSMSALVMELIYRFVWARHTQTIYLKRAPAFAGEEMDLERYNDEDEVLEASDMEDGSESESQSAMSESSFYDDESEDVIMQRDTMGKLKDFFAGPSALGPSEEEEEEDINSQSDGSDEEGTNNGKKRSAIQVEAEHALHYSRNGSEAASEAGADENWLASIPGSTSLFFPHPRIGDALEEIEKAFWADEKFDIRLALDVVLRLTLDRIVDLQLPTQTPTQVVAQMSYAYEQVFSTFISQMGITMVLPEADEKSESTLFDHLSTCWAINKDFGDYWFDTVLSSTFSNLTTNGQVAAVHFVGLFPQLLLNADSKTDAQVSRVYDTLHTFAVSKGTITPHIEKLIKNLDALSAEKSVLIRQNRAQVQAPLSEKPILENDQNNSASSNGTGGGKSFFATAPAIEALSTKLSNDNDDEEDDQDPEANKVVWPADSLEGRLQAHRLQRLKQIDAMIEEIRTEVNGLTGHIDAVQSKRRARRSKGEIALDAATAPDANVNGSAAPAALFQSEEELWGLPLGPKSD